MPNLIAWMVDLKGLSLCHYDFHPAEVADAADYSALMQSRVGNVTEQEDTNDKQVLNRRCANS